MGLNCNICSRAEVVLLSPRPFSNQSYTLVLTGLVKVTDYFVWSVATECDLCFLYSLIKGWDNSVLQQLFNKRDNPPPLFANFPCRQLFVPYHINCKPSKLDQTGFSIHLPKTRPKGVLTTRWFATVIEKC